jgi:hypothetical protein
MIGTLKNYDGAKDDGSARVGARSLGLEWQREWFTTICLMIILAALIFLMMLSIYLVVTKPEPSSIPQEQHARAGGSLCTVDGANARDSDMTMMVSAAPDERAT